MKCTQYEICGQAAFKKARAIIFFYQVGQDGQQFSVGFQKSPKNSWELPQPIFASPYKFVGGDTLTSAPLQSHKLEDTLMSALVDVDADKFLHIVKKE